MVLPVISALPSAGWVTAEMDSGDGAPSSASLIKTGMLTGVPAAVAAVSGLAVGGTGSVLTRNMLAVAFKGKPAMLNFGGSQ